MLLSFFLVSFIDLYTGKSLALNIFSLFFLNLSILSVDNTGPLLFPPKSTFWPNIEGTIKISENIIAASNLYSLKG